MLRASCASFAASKRARCCVAASGSVAAHSCTHTFPGCVIRSLIVPRRAASPSPSSSIQSRGECQRTKSASSHPGFAALNACMSDLSCADCSLAITSPACAVSPSDSPTFNSVSCCCSSSSDVSGGPSCVAGAHSGRPLLSPTRPSSSDAAPTRRQRRAPPPPPPPARASRHPCLATQQLSFTSFWCTSASPSTARPRQRAAAARRRPSGGAPPQASPSTAEPARPRRRRPPAPPRRAAPVGSPAHRARTPPPRRRRRVAGRGRRVVALLLHHRAEQCLHLVVVETVPLSQPEAPPAAPAAEAQPSSSRASPR